MTVINCQQATNNGQPKVWNGKPIYLITLSDGRAGESFSQIAAGTPIADLDIQQTQYGLRIKKKQAFQGGKRGGNESFALAYAKDLVVAGKVELKQILETANKFYAWMESKSKGEPTPSAGVAQPNVQPKDFIDEQTPF